MLKSPPQPLRRSLKSTHAYQLRAFLGYVLPSTLLCLAFISIIIPWQINEISLIKPELPIVILFFWTYVKHNSIPPIIVFCAAIILDIMTPVPLGYNSLLYGITTAIILLQINKTNAISLTLMYDKFIVISLIFYAMQWLFNALYYQTLRFEANIFFAWLITVISFWVLFPLLQWSYRLYSLAHVRRSLRSRDIAHS